jgi:predicted nucleic acid-binding protein
VEKEEMNKAIIDTNVIIYDYIEDSLHHKEAKEILDSLDRWVIPTIVVHELIWFLKGLNLESKLDDIIAYIKNEKAKIVCDCDNNVLKALEILKKEKLTLSNYKDLVILSHSILENYPLATFDKKLSKIAQKYGVTIISK